MLQDEYPHTVEFWEPREIPDGSGGYEMGWAAVMTVQTFMDTPTSREIFQAQQLNNPLDRNLYYPYRTDITADMRCVYEYDGIVETYEIVGKPQDQGGQHEVMKVPLKLVPHGS